MSNDVVKVLSNTSGDKNIDNESLDVDGTTVLRQRIQIAGASALELAEVKNATPDDDAYGVAIRPVGSLVDSVSGALITITQAHHETHEGDAFVADFLDESMADDDTIVLVFKTMTGSTMRAHMITQFSTLVGGDLKLWEGATWTAESGTSINIRNRKRGASMDSSGLLADQAQAGFVAADVIHANPTGLNTGSAVLLQDIVAWGKKDKLLAGGSRDNDEWLLKPDTQYAVVFTAEGGSNKAHVILNWYEHTDTA